MSAIRRPRSEKSVKTKGRAETLADKGDLRYELLGESMVRSLPIGIVTFDPALKIIQANPPAAKLIELGEYIDQSLAKGTNSTDKPPLNWKQQLQSVVSTGKTCTFDSVGYTGNGRTKWLQIICLPLRKGTRQRILGGTILIQDMTEKVNTQKQLANAEKLATLGKLTSKVAHELNDPLDGILRYMNLAIRIIEREGPAKPKEYLARCQQGLMRMVQIVSELLEFSRSSRTVLEYVRIEQIIEEAVETMDAKAEASKIRVSRDYSTDMPQIRSGNLFQVFANIIKNAFDAMPEGGELSISTRVASSNTAVIEFRDTGTGFPAENAEAMFEPFFTTKDKGTGLGLAICRDIIERYHGRITAKNAPDAGSIFTVYLPLAANPQENSQ